MLGGLALRRDGARVDGAAAQPRRLALLALIGRAGARGISRERVQSILWPDVDDEPARHALKQALYALRRDTGAGTLFLGTHDLQLNPDEVECDAVRFDALCRRREFERAVELYDGPFLDGFRLAAVPEFEAWAEEERIVLEGSLARALESLAEDAASRRDTVAAVRWRQRLAALTPLDARATLQLMRAQLAAGDPAGALQQSRIHEALLSQALDLPLDPAVRELAGRIRAGEVFPVTPGAGRTPIAVDPTVSDVAPALAPPGSVMVQPFTDLSPDGAGARLAEALTDTVIAELAGRVGLTVVAPAASQLNAAARLEGRVQEVAAQLRVIARLVSTSSGTVLWSDRYDRPPGDSLALQDDLAQRIADAVERTVRTVAGLPGPPPTRARAEALYEAGMRAWTPQGAGLGQGLDQFRETVAIDPTHAPAHAALAEAYTQLAFYGFMPARRAAELAVAASMEAMRLAPDLAESHVARGTCLLWVDHDFERGTRELELAVELDPASVVARARLAFVRLCHDGPEESDRIGAERAASDAAATALSRVMYGQQLLAAGRNADAIAALHDAIDIEAPSFLAYHWLSVAYLQHGMPAEALGAAVAESSISDRHPWSQANLIVACAASGQSRRGARLLDALEERARVGYVQGSVLGIARTALGDLDEGMHALERAVDEHDPSLMMLRHFPMFAPFRGHPGFRALLRRAGWRDWDTTEFRVPRRD